MIKRKDKGCYNCRFWKTKQRELNYNDMYGFCNGVINEEDEEFLILSYLHNPHSKIDEEYIGKHNSINCINPYASEIVTREDYFCSNYEKQKL
jgi:hypothetical protein